jgi:hypothetical protein
MIRCEEMDFRNLPLRGVVMTASRVLRFSENFDTMTAPECLSFIERSRRQIDRLEHLPQERSEVGSKELASIREALDALEKIVLSDPTNK